MPLYESPGLTIRGMRLGEADKIVTFFTLKYGKIKAVAKGALRLKSRFGGRLEPFSLVNVIVFGKERANLYRLNSIDIIEPFISLKEDFDKMSRAYVSAELVDACQREGDVNHTGFESLLSLWRMLSEETRSEKNDLWLRLFQLKYLSSIGFHPSFDVCVKCGEEPKGAMAGFNAIKGGVVCSRCLPQDPVAFKTTMGAVKLIYRSFGMPAAKLKRLVAGSAVLAEMERIVNSLIEAHVRRKMRSEMILKL